MPLFEVTDYDREFYESRIRDFVPDRVIDIHTHCWLEEFRIDDGDAPRRAVSWPHLVAAQNPVEDLAETFELLLPGKRCGAAIFGYPDRMYDVDASNDYIAGNAGRLGFDPLLLSRPEWSAAEFRARLDAGGFLGAKVYLNFAPEYLPGGEIRILDFAPHHQLEVLDDREAVLILHIPRAERLKDPVNLAELGAIERRYRRLQIVVAHVGRAYCESDLGDAFARLAEHDRLLFDLSANTNESVFAAAIAAVGPQRLLFGSDLPITRMRMRRICERGRYINLVPPGRYGDVSDDLNMREVPAAEADRLTFFFYEEIDAFRRAAEPAGLTPADVRDVFHDNAARILAAARDHYPARSA